MTCICGQVETLGRYYNPETGEKSDEPVQGWELITVTRLRIYREYCLKPPRNSTAAVCKAFAADHAPAVTEVYIMGDYNGKSAIPGLPDWTNFEEIFSQLWEYTHNYSDVVKPNVGVYKRRDLVNAILRGSFPELEILFDSDECPMMVNDLTFTKEGTDGKFKKMEVDTVTGQKYQALGHTGDALEYMVCNIFEDYLKQTQ
jgi:hypothetical protein